MTTRTRNERPHDAEGQFQTTIEDLDKDRQAAELRSFGYSYRQIAEAQGITVSTAHNRVQKALQAVPAPAVAELRARSGMRLMKLMQEAFLIVVDRSADKNTRVRAIESCRRLDESYRRLFGADMPAEIRVSVSDPMLAEIERLAAELDVQDPTRAAIEAGSRIE